MEYLETLKVKGVTKRAYEDTLFFFIESLRGDSTAVIESEDGDYLLKHDWDVYYGGAVSSFIDFWLPRKVMEQDIATKAPSIMRKWIKWSYEKGYFDKEHYDELISAVPAGKSKEVKRLQKATELLYRLHTPQPGAWMDKNPKVVSIHSRKRPEVINEGYMRVVKLAGETCHLETQEGDKVGPVKLSKELVAVLNIGDIMNITVGRYGKSWVALESGNVYGEDAGF